MRLTQIVRAFGLFLVLGIGGSVVGCGSAPEESYWPSRKMPGRSGQKGIGHSTNR